MGINQKPTKPTSLRSAYTNLLIDKISRITGNGTLPKRKLPTARLAVFCVLVAVTLGAISFGEGMYDSKFHYDPAIHYRIQLNTDSITSEDLTKAMPVLNKRLELFAGAGNFKIEDAESGLELYLPKAAFHSQNITSTVDMLLTSPGKLFLVNINPEDASEFRSAPLESADIEDLKISQGSIDGINPTDYGIAESEYRYLKFKLSDSAREKMNYDLSASWDDNFFISQDMGSDPTLSYLFKLNSSKDEGYYRVLLASGSDNFLNTAINNWQGTTMPDGIEVVEDFEQNAHWQKPSDITHPGELQKTRSEISGEDAIVVAFRTTGSDYAPGEIFDIETEYKARYDAIGQPYAFGIYTRFGRTYMVFKTSSARMGQPVYNMLRACDDMDICAGPACATIGLANSSAVVVPGTDDTLSLRVRTSYDTDMTKVSNLKSFASTYDEKNFLLSAGQGYILSGSVAGTPEDSSIVFDTLCNSKATKISKNNAWVLDLMASIINSETTMRPMEYVGDSSDIDGIKPGVPDYDTNRYSSAIKKIKEAKNVKAVSTDGQYMEIVLDIKADDKMPEKFDKQVREIMKEIDFGNTSLVCVSIYPSIPSESAKTGVEIRKNLYTCYNSVYSLWDSRYSVETFASGDYEEYAYQIRSLMDQLRYDEFADRY